MTNMPSSIVIGTAGHIDHGKTTLVRALTGIDADRLPEEKRRGITIDLGFASFDLPTPNGSPLRISFVDVPGHSLFIRNMLAGAGCVPAVMLVVAADEGIMPQTVEHLAICYLLGVSEGLTVITKADTVSASQLQEVTDSIKRFLQGTFLSKDHAPVVPASAATGAGLETVRAELVNLAMRTPLETSDAMLRMPLDRSFVIKGFGTVVTGTLISGTIRDGETLHLEPGDRAVRVRGLQSHGEPVQYAPPGSRVAVNLSGIDANQVRRGETLVSPRTLSAVDTLDVEVRLLESAPALKHRANIHFHAFTSETMASVSLYGYEAAKPGTLRLMRLRLAEPIVLVPGDRFVLRQPSPAGTIGGGRVLDAHPLPRQKKAPTQGWLEQLRAASPTAQLSLRVSRCNATGITLDRLSAETGLTRDAIRLQIDPAIELGDLYLISNNLLLSREAFLMAAHEITTCLRTGERVKSSELRGRSALSHPVFGFVVNSLVQQKKIQLRDETVSIYNADVPASNSESDRLAAIARAYEDSGLAAPSVLELAKRFNIKETDMRRLITALQRDKTILRMGSDDLFIHSAVLSRLAAQLAPLRGSLMNVARFKQLTGISRKYAIPLLEYLDRQRITLKQNGERLIL
ncbi:MAG TPA: selenocysteine-specific translation elongation factor [Terracidiphilus sp.]|nr:selenocysteine-specific translation elongation factor [Terracidiphilus sp.]